MSILDIYLHITRQIWPNQRGVTYLQYNVACIDIRICCALRFVV